MQKGLFTRLFEVVLQETGVGPGSALLNIGCVACVCCEIVARLGAHVPGLDAAEPLLDIVRERVPQANFQSGEMDGITFSRPVD
jgi:2-polyprenyl-3-methyl-5-hydroxy-6-metoxy-1,4-benzoquinol methylase